MNLIEIIQVTIIGLFSLGGLFFFLVGTVGIIRMPDVFCRMHATTKCDTLGAGLIFIAVMIWRGFDVITLKILLVLIFVWITNPTAAHIIAKAEYRKSIDSKTEKEGLQ